LQFAAETSLAITVIALALAPFAVGQDSAPTSPPVWDGQVARLGGVTVDPQTRTLTASGWVNQVSGPIELLACGPGGKTHESVFVLDVNPVDLQAGLLLLGLKPGKPPAGLGTGRPEGTGLEIRVEWNDSTGSRSERAESFVYNTEAGRVLPETPWIFTGSVMEDGEFKALAEESLIVTYWDPWAIVNIPLACGSNDEILFVNEKLVPAVRTPVTFRIREHQKKGPWWRRWKRK
jgi:hypothetical protein